MDLNPSQLRKKKKGLCVTHYCRNSHSKNRNYCHKCISKKWRRDNPIKAAFNILRSNAKARGKLFTLTFDQFKEVIKGTDYINNKGRKPDNLHLDRINVHKGYEYGNVRVITAAENREKQHTEDYPKEYEHKDAPF